MLLYFSSSTLYEASSRRLTVFALSWYNAQRYLSGQSATGI